MPELPEVETIRKSLSAKLCGHMFTRVVMRRRDLRRKVPKNLDALMTHARVLDVHRRSKYLLMDLDNHHTVIIHLGMSGRLFFSDPVAELHKHDHVILNLDDGRQLRFRDPRRFGLIDICKTDALIRHPLLASLGVEPLSPEFTPQLLHTLCKKSDTSIKSLLMNAKLIVGVGNIYACEALFAAGIRPTRRASRLTMAQAERLHAAIQHVLRASIAAGGTTFRDYVDADARPGLHAVALAVYGREGKSCRHCKTPIQRSTQQQRSSFFCPVCQK